MLSSNLKSTDTRLLLIDVAHLFWAAWHATALEQVSRAASETIDSVHRTLRDVEHTHHAICIDWPPYWRTERCSEYKAQRATPSEHATAQFRRVRERLALEHTVWGVPGLEADDVIAAATVWAMKAGHQVVIATGDKDLAQLVTQDHVWLWRQERLWGPAEVKERFGVGPELIRHMLTLTGDKSDNIPGIRGVGEKKAAMLLARYGTWWAAVEAAKVFDQAIPMALADSLRAHTDYDLAWELVGLRYDAAIDFGALFGQPQVLGKTENTQQQQETAVMGKMSVTSVSRGRLHVPYDILLYGQEGIGKSSFAADAPSPVFFDLEAGTEELDVERMPRPSTWEEFEEGMRSLAADKHEFKTAVIDTADALERLIHKHVCGENDVNSIEEIGFGKGYLEALGYWEKYIEHLRSLRARGMNTITLAHCQVKLFANPLGEDYDRYQLKLNKHADGLLKDRVKAVLFVKYDEAVKTAKQAKSAKNKALGDGKRVVFTETRPAFDAKNRYGLPFEMALSWEEFDAAAKAGTPATLEQVTAELDELTTALDEPTAAKLKGLRDKAAGDTKKLVQLVDWARSKKQEVAA